MSLGDFSSVVQLGVGLHAGTALLQSLSEFAGAPLSNQLARLRTIAEARAKRNASAASHFETANDLAGDLEVKKVQFFNEYREIAAINTGIAIALCLLLAIIAFNAQSEAPVWANFAIVLASLVPAPVLMCFLWNRWMTQTAALRDATDKLKTSLLGSVR